LSLPLARRGAFLAHFGRAAVAGTAVLAGAAAAQLCCRRTRAEPSCLAATAAWRRPARQGERAPRLRTSVAAACAARKYASRRQRRGGGGHGRAGGRRVRGLLSPPLARRGALLARVGRASAAGTAAGAGAAAAELCCRRKPAEPSFLAATAAWRRPARQCGINEVS